MPRDETELKPCPFCGGEAEVTRAGYVRCSKRGACTVYPAADDAKSWQKRAADPEMLALLESLTLELEDWIAQEDANLLDYARTARRGHGTARDKIDRARAYLARQSPSDPGAQRA